MPEVLFRSNCPDDASFQKWADEIIGSSEHWDHVFIAIDREVAGKAEFAEKLRRRMAHMVLTVLQRMPLNELFVEGGATASEIAARFGWTRFEPCDLLAPGVVRMKVLESDPIYLTIKPGSYPWPKDIGKKR